MTPSMARNLIDPDDGENRAVRSFLLLYGGTRGLTVEGMRKHMSMSGWDGMWPEWVNTLHGEHLTKGGAQNWLRHLFALELPVVTEGYVLVPVEPTKAMVAAYLAANTAYWQRTDELPAKRPDRWRQGTPAEATAESYRAMLTAAPKWDAAMKEKP